MPGPDHYAQGLLDEVEHCGFGTPFRVEINRLQCFLGGVLNSLDAVPRDLSKYFGRAILDIYLNEGFRQDGEISPCPIDLAPYV